MQPSPQSNSRTSHHPKRRPATSSHSRFLLPHPWQPLLSFLSPWMCLFRTFHIMKAYTLWPFVSGFSCLPGCFHGLPMLQRASRLCSFLGPNNAPLYGYTPFCLFMLFDGHLGYFHFSTLILKTSKLGPNQLLAQGQHLPTTQQFHSWHLPKRNENTRPH